MYSNSTSFFDCLWRKKQQPKNLSTPKRRQQIRFTIRQLPPLIFRVCVLLHQCSLYYWHFVIHTYTHTHTHTHTRKHTRTHNHNRLQVINENRYIYFSETTNNRNEIQTPKTYTSCFVAHSKHSVECRLPRFSFHAPVTPSFRTSRHAK